MIELIYNIMLIMLPVIYLINIIYNWFQGEEMKESQCDKLFDKFIYWM